MRRTVSLEVWNDPSLVLSVEKHAREIVTSGLN